MNQAEAGDQGSMANHSEQCRSVSGIPQTVTETENGQGEQTSKDTGRGMEQLLNRWQDVPFVLSFKTVCKPAVLYHRWFMRTWSKTNRIWESLL